MPGCFLSVRPVCALAFLLAISGAPAGAQGEGASLPRPFTGAETLHYSIEWRLITATHNLLKLHRHATPAA